MKMSQSPSSLDPNAENTVVEILFGKQIVSPRPAAPHINLASRLGAILMPPYSFKLGGPGGWHIMDEPELHLGEDQVVPDLAGWRIERSTEELQKAVSISLAPDWVCEVLSPSTARIDRTKKLEIYNRETVEHVWLIDPAIQVLEVFKWKTGHYFLLGAYDQSEPLPIEPFGEVRLDLLWNLPK